MDRRRLHAGLRRPDAGRRDARRPARSQEDHARRRRRLLRRIARRGTRTPLGHAHHGPRRDGRRRCRVRARNALLDPADLPRSPPPRPRARRVDVRVRHLARGRARARRSPRRRVRLARHLLVQRRLRAPGARCGVVDAARELGPAGPASRRARSGAGRRRRVGPDLRRDRGGERGLLYLVDRGSLRPRGRHRGPFRPRRAADRRPGRPPRVLQDPRLLERERRRLRHELRPLRRVLLHRAVPPDRGEVLGREDRTPVRRDGRRDGRRRAGRRQVDGRARAARADAARLRARGRRDVRGRLAALPERRPVGALGGTRSRRARARPRAAGGDGLGARDRAGRAVRAWRPRR